MKQDLRITVYPFHENMLPFCTFIPNAPKIVRLVSPIGYGLDGQDASFLDGREEVNLRVSHDFEEALLVSNAVLFPEVNYTDELKKMIMQRMKQAAMAGKHIFSAIELDDINIMKAICVNNGVEYIDLTQHKASNALDIQKPQRLYVPKASIIFVGEFVDHANSADIVVGLVSYFINKGYKVTAVMEPKESAVFGFHTHIECLMGLPALEHEKIHAINNWIKRLDEEETPDLLVVQLPGGMLRFDDIETSQYGIYAYMWSQAITPDYVILCTPYLFLDPDKKDYIDKVFQYRFGYVPDAVHFSNSMLDSEAHNVYFESVWSYQPLSAVEEVLENRKTKENRMYCALKRGEMERLCQDAEKTLIDLADIHAI